MRSVKFKSNLIYTLLLLLGGSSILIFAISEAMSAIYHNILTKAQPVIDGLRSKSMPQEDIDGVSRIVEVLSLSLSMNIMMVSMLFIAVLISISVINKKK
jgi:ABC-type long-subunit fatty acid transport system fused permease/ATPase subunit